MFHECTDDDFAQFEFNESIEDEKKQFENGQVGSTTKKSVKYFCVKGFEDYFVSGQIYDSNYGNI